MTEISAVLIEDERFARADLRRLLEPHSQIHIVGEADTFARAQKLLRQERPDLVFLDIELPGGSGFDLLPLLDPQTQVVFITAFDHYAVRAFEVNALDYLVKPVAPERLAESIERLRGRARGRAPAPPRRLAPQDRLYVQHDAGQHFVRLPDLLVVLSLGGNYTTAELVSGDELTVRRTLKQWEAILPPQFCRTHRASIVNLDLVRGLERQRDGTHLLFLTVRAEPLPVSRRQLPTLRAALAALA